MIQQGLDELSQEFAGSLFLAFPAWEQFARVIKGDENGDGCIELHVPQKDSDRFLQLSTAEREITIAFDHWHTHIGTFLGLDTAESVATAMAIIQSFVTENAVVKCCYRGNVWVESSLEYRVAPTEPKPDCRTEVFSWHSTHDEIIEGAGRLPRHAQ